MIPPDTSSESAKLPEAAPLEYARQQAERPIITGAGRRAWRIGRGCWCAYAILLFVELLAYAGSRPQPVAPQLCAFGVVIFINIFASIGFFAACSSLQDERREWRGVAGLIINFLALWPTLAFLAILISGWLR
jgi:hypothetical protein